MSLEQFGPFAEAFSRNALDVPGYLELLGLQARVGAGHTIGPVFCRGFVTSTGAFDSGTYEYDRVNDKIVALASARTQVANVTDLSTITVEVTAVTH